MKNKKVRITVIAVAIVLAVAAAVFAFWYINQSNITVEVTPVSQLATTWWGTDSVTEGMVSTEVAQSIYLGSSDLVSDILVYEGQQIAAGTALLEYDTTLLEIQAEINELDIDILKTKIRKAETELSSFKKDYSAALAAALATGEGSDNVAIPGYVQEGEDSIPVGGIEDGEIIWPSGRLDRDSLPYTGDGSEENPYKYFLRSGGGVGSGFILRYVELPKAVPVYVEVEYREGNDYSGKLVCVWSMIFWPDGSYDFELKLDEELAPNLPWTSPTPTPSESPSPSPSESVSPSPSSSVSPSVKPSVKPSTSPTPTVYPGPAYTSEELKLLYNSMQKDVSDMKLDLRQLELNLKTTNRKLEEGVVYSTIDGVVAELSDPDTAMLEGTPLLTVAGGTGYYITGQISELELDYLAIGQNVDVMSWRTGTSCKGAIVEIGDYPVAGAYYSSGSSKVSYYPFTVYVSGENRLAEGEYVQMTISMDDTTDAEGTLYLLRAYVREDENGRSCVYTANEEGLLEKRFIQTGKLLWGSYIEIVSGLTADDLIAFPYGKDVKEGVKTTIANNDGFYPYY